MPVITYHSPFLSPFYRHFLWQSLFGMKAFC
nr:MAG TPA: hypothetical protein [Caudoviricetes sp.]